jgi:ankyrin repeat protein
MRIRHVQAATILAIVVSAVSLSAAGDTRVVDAARSGSRDAVQAAIKARADVNAAEADGTTALHWAVRRGDARTVDLLLTAGADAKTANRYGVTPLVLAATAGDAVIADRLLKAGADANAVGADGETVLMVASRTGNVDVIKALVARGASVSAGERWMGETPLVWAAAENHAAAIRTLAELGADVNAKTAAVRYPAQKPKDPSNYVTSAAPKGEWTPLMYAAREGATDAALTLVALGANVNLRDNDGMTPLIEAVINMHLDLAAKLLDKGADPNLADNSGMSALFAAVDMRTPAWERGRPDAQERDTLDCLDMMRVLLDHGADPNLALKGRMLQRYHAGGPGAFIEGTTPLMRAARYSNLDMVRLLVERGANVQATQKDGTTALMLAAGVKYAITQEGDPENSGTFADSLEIVKLLADKGADVNATNSLGQTAMYGAAFVGKEPVIRFLADRGARMDAKTTAGLSIYDAVLNKGVSDDGTGSRVGGKPGPALVALVRNLMDKAGVPIAEKPNVQRAFGARAANPDPSSVAAPTTTPAQSAPQK